MKSTTKTFSWQEILCGLTNVMKNPILSIWKCELYWHGASVPIGCNICIGIFGNHLKIDHIKDGIRLRFPRPKFCCIVSEIIKLEHCFGEKRFWWLSHYPKFTGLSRQKVWWNSLKGWVKKSNVKWDIRVFIQPGLCNAYSTSYEFRLPFRNSCGTSTTPVVIAQRIYISSKFVYGFHAYLSTKQREGRSEWPL